MAITTFELQEKYLPSSWEKGQYLGPWTLYYKNKNTLLSQTLKVAKKESVISFFICDPGAEIWPLYLFNLRRTSTCHRHGIKGRNLLNLFLNFKRQNGHNSAPGPEIKETMDTFYSPTFKVIFSFNMP